MTTITDPQTWLSALPGPRGPTRGKWAPEGYLAPGDVTENGEIVLHDCVTQAAGIRSVEMHQAIEATYYGWQLSGMTVYRGDKVMTQIFRYT
jgi:hypothetical protein